MGIEPADTGGGHHNNKNNQRADPRNHQNRDQPMEDTQYVHILWFYKQFMTLVGF